jgi:tripartite-type tricarboxylate transporter receptor subunit TctC
MKAMVACGVLATAAFANAESKYPAEPVHIVVPFSAGGQFDTVARMLGKFAAQKLGQSVVIDNVSGGGGNIGAAKVARAKPDGYTLLTMGGNHTVAHALYAHPGYDVLKDFKPISLVTVSPHVVLVNTSVPIKTFGEFVTYSKQHPEALTYGTPGVGTSMHLTFELVKQHYGIKALHVPYRGGSKMLMDLEGGQVQAGIVAIAPALQAIKTGRVRPLAVTSKERSPALPDVPALSEIGFPSLDAGSWLGLVGPQGMPAEAVARWNDVIKAFVNDPESKKKLENVGFRVDHTTPEQFAKFIREEYDTYGKVVRDNKISAQ